MTDTRFHLGWFTYFGQNAWNDPLGSAPEPWTGDLHRDLARSMERACFDYMLIEDTLSIPTAFKHGMETYLKHGIMVPKHDPVPLAAILGADTRHLGIVTTLSTMAYPPFMLARLISTMDHLTRGRFGWNIVTSAENAAALNMGLAEIPPRQLRYDMADEYVALVEKLIESWEPDAVIRDAATDTYADASKVHPVNFEGRWYSAPGPLNTVRCPQGRPAFIQAGGSPRGRRFAAEHADSVIASTNGIAGMKAYRDDIRKLAGEAGRNPDDIKVLSLIAPIVAETRSQAQEMYARALESPGYTERALALFSSFTDVDFSQYDLDQPLPPLTTNAEQGALDKFCQTRPGSPASPKTLRQLVRDSGTTGALELVGTPDDVADMMGDAMAQVGGDGFLITTPFHRLSRVYVNGITDGLVPALQRRGLTRTAYTKTTLRETLKEF
ncbi:NtaA/DmoA family FMN-dependent monooxygenase [Beijerinckia sp. L45]|uniref:NtaA/DmoA family FMN-dependent monooxygenase n=1 Tax=Beijerinckia sp. L45 TaxID=1641855 RepID=UPI00131CA0E2|nr:NtaA/DmoA family FMN-dependent monooxygenase [Beijerinckia sp. L45]